MLPKQPVILPPVVPNQSMLPKQLQIDMNQGSQLTYVQFSGTNTTSLRLQMKGLLNQFTPLQLLGFMHQKDKRPFLILDERYRAVSIKHLKQTFCQNTSFSSED